MLEDTKMNKEFKDKLDYISDLIGEEVDPQSADQMLAKLNSLIAFSGYMSGLVAEAERAYKYALLDAYKSFDDETKPPSTVHSKVLEAMAADESAAHTYADKLNAALRVSVEGLRTMISLYKTETENNTR